MLTNYFVVKFTEALSFVIILLSSRQTRLLTLSQTTPCIVIQLRGRKNARKIRRKCYHLLSFVIIFYDNKKTTKFSILVLFFKFFLAPKNDFLHPSKTCDHYALIFYNKTCKIILLFFRFDLHKSRKIFEKMDKNRCPKMRSTKYFWENSTRTR